MYLPLERIVVAVFFVLSGSGLFDSFQGASIWHSLMRDREDKHSEIEG